MLCFGFYLQNNICVRVLHIGNAAIVLRSRLKVRVLKENWEKKAKVDEKGIILTNGDIENSRKAVQYQVDLQLQPLLYYLLVIKKSTFSNINIHIVFAKISKGWFMSVCFATI